MSTLKKVLALTVVFAMALTFMAGAFTDNADIDNMKAVDMASALGIIKGYPDGSFGPDKVVTRAEMAKMIYIVKNGKDDGGTYYANAINPFYDTTSHWAKGYINYCYSLGIIAGKGNGKFDPDAPVTGLEAAKMALTIIGYDATKAGLTGAQWALNTASLATENGLFEDYGSDIAAGAPRQSAAQIIYNALFADYKVWSEDLGGYTEYVNNSDETITIGEKYMGLETEEGILLSADGFAIEGAPDDDDTIYVEIGYDDDEEEYIYADFEAEGYKDMVGQNVKVVYKSSNNKVYGVISAGDNTVYDVKAFDIDSSTKKDIKFGGKDYTLEDETIVYVNYSSVAKDYEALDYPKPALYDLASSDPVRLVDNDGDSKIDYIFLTHYTFDKVDAMDDEDIDLAEEGVLSIEDDIEAYYDDMEEGDYVLYYEDESNEKYTIIKTSSVSGKLTGISGTTLKLSGSNISKSTFAATIGDAESDEDNIANNGTYTIYTDGKYWLGVIDDGESGDTGNYALLIKTQLKVPGGISGKPAKAEVIIPGEDDPVVYEIDSVRDSDGEKISLTDAEDDIVDYEHQLFAYSITSAGKIKLSQEFDHSDDGDLTYKDSTKVVTVGGTSAKIGSSTVIFYQTGDAYDDYEVYKVGDLDASIEDDATGTLVYATGSPKTAKAVLFLGDLAEQDGGTSDNLYGYITDYYEGTDEDDDEFVEYTIWAGSAKVLRQYDYDDVYGKNTIVVYTVKNDGDIDEINRIYRDDLDEDILPGTGVEIVGAGQLKSSIGDDLIVKVEGEFESIYTVTDDTVIMSVDSSDKKGTDVTPKKVGVNATEDEWNVFYVINDDDEVLWVIYDGDNDIYDTLGSDD